MANLYDYTAKFETEVEVSILSVAGDKMFSELGVNLPVMKETIKTKIDVIAGPLITDENKAEFCRIQNQEYKKGMENKEFQQKIGRRIKVKETKFVGYERINEHKEG